MVRDVMKGLSTKLSTDAAVYHKVPYHEIEKKDESKISCSISINSIEIFPIDPLYVIEFVLFFVYPSEKKPAANMLSYSNE